MPELPEVEFAARCLRRWARGRRVEAVELDPGARRILRPSTPQAFARALRGARVEEIRRIGKHLLVTLAQDGAPLGLLSHLGMTGKWLRTAGAAAPPRHSRARLRLDDGRVLHYQDLRLFGRLRLVPGARFEAVPEVAALGPDPLAEGIDVARLAAALARTRLPVKVKLLDQRLLPGVGNIHAGEACFRARLDPRRPARSLSRAEVKRLAGGILASFHLTLDAEKGPEITYVEEGGANPFLVYAREGEPCPRCGRETIRRVVQAGRSTFHCSRCQR
ncbi:MAG TPA: bifunctional DNA-formamidopyrimidine glycosylase/DNA-(apurinic or apyrimidinic site) lyase [Anaeromyxobacter sp.]|nr:bifunctional DNA-formamidopyrimidine glycosylase/DNA-(apurinic or apyrimidinic site) lyase [Anaeromyxobacter sp.]